MVGDGHTIYYRTHGQGRPALILHGGPGGGMDEHSLASYDLSKWMVVQFDQRGCGKSRPFGSIQHNTTWDLVKDIEGLRQHLGIEKWFVSGGSWGTTLALAYAETHPSRVTGLLLRGSWLGDSDSMKWLYEKGGASEVFPDAWRGFLSVLPARLHAAPWRDIIKYYHTKLNGPDAQRYADAWWKWEADVSQLIPVKDDTSTKGALALARLENHYFLNNCWLKEGQLLKGASKLKKIPITMVHGRYDMVCPISGAMALREALPHANLVIIPDAGHSSREPGIRRALLYTTEWLLHRNTHCKSRTRKRHRD